MVRLVIWDDIVVIFTSSLCHVSKWFPVVDFLGLWKQGAILPMYFYGDYGLDI